MNLLSKFVVSLSCMLLSLPALGAAKIGQDTPNVQSSTKQILLAKKAKKGKKRGKKGKSKGVREKHISREARQKGADSKNIDFDAADIGGARKTPMSSLVTQNKADKNYDFVKIRLRWHPEMIQSASSLSSGQ
jgi:hypothetical protein